MDAERWRRTRALFDQLVEVPSDKWPERLAQLCADDPAVQAEALALLRADSEVSLGSGVAARAPALLDAAAEHHERLAAAELTGTRIGPFQLLHELGRGGMGQVWLAQRADGEFVQQVAIKLVRSGWDADELLARFRAERQILASLQHPHIAHLVDGGVSAGKPWLALEYVDGVNLREYCDAQRLGLAARLRLFLTVCDAVSYAHARLVVHRDLKPSNLLVDTQGMVKLLDFGIAKLIDSDSATSATRMFTPEYAAPEQVRGEMVTTAVDVYALGLLLYELLCGRRPYKVDNSTPAAYERAILDQEPTRPSVVVGGVDEEAVARAARRHLTPELLRRELRGDLDAVVMKALRKQPAERYASVADLAADVQAHLDNRPVVARRGNWRYRAGRFLRRHAVVAGLSAAMAAAIVVGFGVALWQRGIALQERDRAEMEAESARRIAAFLQQVFENAAPNARPGEVVSARQLLDEGERAIRADLTEQPQIRAALLETLGAARSAVGDPKGAVALVKDAVALRQGFQDRLAEAAARARLAHVLNMANQTEDALAEATLARQMAVGDTQRAREVRAHALYQIGESHLNLRHNKEAEAALRVVVDEYRALYGSDSEQFATALRPLAFQLGWQGRSQEAFDLVDPAWQELAAKIPPGDARREPLIDIEAEVLKKRGRYDEALALMRETLAINLKIYGPDHRTYRAVQQNLVTALYASGHYPESIALGAELIAWRRKNPAVPMVLRLDMSLEVYGKALAFGGHFDEAIAVFDEELALARQLVPLNADALSSSMFWLAHTERRRGHFTAAAAWLDQLDAFAQAHDDTTADAADIGIERARLAVDRGVPDRDCATAKKAVDFRRKAGRNDKAIAEATLAICLLAANRRDDAAALMPGLLTLHADRGLPPLTRESVDDAVALWQKGA